MKKQSFIPATRKSKRREERCYETNKDRPSRNKRESWKIRNYTVEEFCKFAGDAKQQRLITNLKQKAALLQKENSLQMKHAKIAGDRLRYSESSGRKVTKMLHEKECARIDVQKPKNVRISKTGCTNEL